MKFNILRSIGHNIADSLSSGCSLLAGMYGGLDVYGNAARSADHYVGVNFLDGNLFAGEPSESLVLGVKLLGEALPALCAKHGIDISSFARLEARYYKDWWPRFAVIVEDEFGRCATDEYFGTPGKLARVLDARGRIRPKRGLVTRNNIASGA